jgi:predicted 2-oxoglutarate/Fe(II)-dependent dioxygenase YbiX
VSQAILSKILVVPEVITPEGLATLVSYMRASELIDAAVFDPEGTHVSGESRSFLNKEIRNTQFAPVDPMLPQLNDLIQSVVAEIINPYYRFEIYSYEKPLLLRYGVGGHYEPHIDGEALWTRPDGTTRWRKSLDRDISFVLWLNDDFDGGEFIFTDLGVSLSPKPGMLVCFPSTHDYRHGVMPVTRGERYALVTWMRVKGWKTMADEERELLEEEARSASC